MKDATDTATVDWVGQAAARRRPAEVRNTRDAVAEQKAVAALQLGGPINSIPPRIKAGGTVADVREWKVARNTASKIAGNSRASLNELNSAINNMRRLWA
jgi:hypothetical protein